MRSKVPTQEIIKDPQYGSTQSVVKLGHRHLEKEKPMGVSTPDGMRYIIPVDFLALGDTNLPFLQDVEEVSFVYNNTKGV